MKATTNEMGMVSEIISAARHFPRKNNTTNTTKSKAYKIDSSKELIEFWISSAVS